MDTRTDEIRIVYFDSNFDAQWSKIIDFGSILINTGNEPKFL